MQPHELVSDTAYAELLKQHGEHVVVTGAVLIAQCMDAEGEPTLTFVRDDGLGAWVHLGMLEVIRTDLLDALRED